MAPIASAEKVCIPANQARIIAQALQRFERLKPAYLRQQQAIGAWRYAHVQDSIALAGKDRLIAWHRTSYAEEQQLRQDSNAKLQISQGKARRRGFLVALELVGLALAGYVIVTK